MEFLTDAQVAGYGRFDGVPSRADLERFFFLDDADKDLLGDRRGDHNRLGLMLQATTARYVGRFLEDPLDVPWPVVEYLAEQLGIADVSCVKRYTDRAMTAYEHSWQVRQAHGFRVFDDAERCGPDARVGVAGGKVATVRERRWPVFEVSAALADGVGIQGPFGAPLLSFTLAGKVPWW